jgi:hypothetical protein
MQNYSNHSRLNPLHHFTIIPLSIFLLIWVVTKFFNSNHSLAEQIFYSVTALLILLVGLITRLYALKNQDRLIRMEMRFRYFELAGKSFSSIENQLSVSQIIALRFAGDDELLDLIERSLNEKLSSKEIKMAIKNWKADLNRV